MSTVEPLVGQHFAYAHGRIGVLKQSMMESSDVDRLLGCSDGAEAERILTELKMTNAIDQGISEGTEILRAVAAWIHAEIDLLVPASKKPIFTILWLGSDVPLLSYLLKQRMGLTSDVSEEPRSFMPTYSPDALRALVFENEPGLLPDHLVTFVRDLLKEEKLSARSIDTRVAQYMFTLRLRLARTSGSSAIKQYVQHLIDLQNIRTALRMQEDSPDEKREVLLEGGTIPLRSLLGSVEEIQAAIDTSPIAFQLTDNLVEHTDDLSALERELSHVTARDIAEMWNVPMGLEPVFAFAATAISQLKLLRVLLIGKRNGLSPQEIKQALPPFLSASHYVL